MKTYNYNKEISTLITLFASALNDIIVKRYDINGNIIDNIAVNFRYSPKSRTLSDLINKSGSIQIPVVAFYITNLARDSTRVFNNIEGSYTNTSPLSSSYEHLLQPLPIDLTLGLSIIARFQVDIDQLISNILTWFDPYIVISHKLPQFDREVRTPVIWSEQISMQYPIELTNNQQYHVIADTSFTIKGWLYKPHASPTGKIYKIDSNFTSLSTVFDNYYEMSQEETSDNTDYNTISARPFVRKVVPYMNVVSSYNNDYALIGDMFNYTSAVFISASKPNIFSNYVVSSYNIFSVVPSLSTKYPAFSGMYINNWVVESNNLITFTLPSAVKTGQINVGVVSEAGYGWLIQDSSSLSPSSTYRFGWEDGITIQ